MPINESALTKGQIRKLNALRKSIGDDLAEEAFGKWLARQAPAAPPSDPTTSDNTLEAAFCVSALEAALTCYRAPRISNTDQDSQFTSEAHLRPLLDRSVKISMDGKGRWIDNRFVERLWRSLKYESVYLEELTGGHHARRVIASRLDHYNHRRPHQTLAGRTLAEMYFAARDAQTLEAVA